MRTCIGIFFLSLALMCGVITYDFHYRVVPQVTADLAHISTDTDDLREMTNAALFQAEEVLHHTDQLLEVEKGAQQSQLAQTQKVLDQLTTMINNADQTQLKIGWDVHNSLAAMPIVLKQTSDTLASTQKDMAALEPAIKEVTPLLKQTTDIASNLNKTTSDVEHEVHSLVYPPPRKWYQKYLLDPVKMAAKVVTFSLNK